MYVYKSLAPRQNEFSVALGPWRELTVTRPPPNARLHGKNDLSLIRIREFPCISIFRLHHKPHLYYDEQCIPITHCAGSVWMVIGGA